MLVSLGFCKERERNGFQMGGNRRAKGEGVLIQFLVHLHKECCSLCCIYNGFECVQFTLIKPNLRAMEFEELFPS